MYIYIYIHICKVETLKCHVYIHIYKYIYVYKVETLKCHSCSLENEGWKGSSRQLFWEIDSEICSFDKKDF